MITPKERPILFSAPMMRAIQDGRKTQTRRIISRKLLAGEGAHVNNCPYGKPGDRLWVRETFNINDEGKYIYAADLNDMGVQKWVSKWKPSIHMPRCASRIDLKITGVRIELLQDISEEDAIAEGCIKFPFEDDHAYTFKENDKTGHATHTGAFRNLFNSINGPESWDLNPWVWVVEFKVLEVMK